MQARCKHGLMSITMVVPCTSTWDLYRVPPKQAELMQSHLQLHQPHPSRIVNLCKQVPKVIDLLSPRLLGTHQAKTNDAS